MPVRRLSQERQCRAGVNDRAPVTDLINGPHRGADRDPHAVDENAPDGYVVECGRERVGEERSEAEIGRWRNGGVHSTAADD